MQLPARTIWDTRLQCVGAVLSAAGQDGPELYFTANFAQATLDPPRVIINPNRLYPIEPILREGRLVAINVLAASQATLGRAAVAIRRRQADKARVLGVSLETGPLDIPYLAECQRTLFAEIESVKDTGDHTVMVARVLETRVHPVLGRERPLLYQDVLGGPGWWRSIRGILSSTGVLDLLRRLRWRLRPPAPADLPTATYLAGGQTDAEVDRLTAPGMLDTGRLLRPASPPRAVRPSIGVCVVGTGWGQQHVRYLRQAAPDLKVYLCGRSEERTAGLARRLGASGYFTSLEAAASDPRVQALTVALPHDLHRHAVEVACANGRHVLVEKPIATTLADADAMIAAAKQSGVTFMVAEDMHYRPGVREAVALIEQGAIGEPLYLLGHVAGVMQPGGWKAAAGAAGGGTWMDNGVHYVRAVRLLMGEPDRIFATRAMQLNTRVEGEDSAQVILDSRLGWQAHLFLSWAANRGPVPDLIVHGEKGVLHLNPGAGYLDLFPNAPTPVSRAVSLVRPYWLQSWLQRPWQQRQRIRFPDRDLTGYGHEMADFLAAIVECRPPQATAEAARRDLEVVLGGYTALSGEAWHSLSPNLREP